MHRTQPRDWGRQRGTPTCGGKFFHCGIPIVRAIPDFPRDLTHGVVRRREEISFRRRYRVFGVRVFFEFRVMYAEKLCVVAVLEFPLGEIEGGRIETDVHMHGEKY